MSGKQPTKEEIEELKNAVLAKFHEEENLPPKVMKRVDALEKLHDSIGEIDKEYKKERAALEHKYSALRVVLYGQRKDIITGEVEVPEAAEAEGEAVKGIPGFWFRALANHPSIGEFITEEDIPALEALTNITVTYNESYSSFKLVFHFAENAFFSNQTLEKSYELTPDILEEKSPTLAGSTGTVIQWKPSKDLTVTEIKKKQKAKTGKNKGQVRTVTRLEPKPSFFHYFSDPVEDPEDEEGGEDEDEQKFKIGIEEDYDIGHAVRTDVIPDAIKWYTGEAIPDDIDFGGEEDDEEDEEEDEEEEDDDDDDDDKEVRKAPVKGKGASGGFAAPGGAGAAGGENPECKQN